MVVVAAVSDVHGAIRVDAGTRVADVSSFAAPGADTAADAAANAAADREIRVFGRDTPLTGVLLNAVQIAGTPVLIEDTRSHALVRATPIIRGVRVLACAAVPLFNAEWNVIGALCAWDGVPRWWSDRDLQLLTHLAGSASALLSLRAASSAPSNAPSNAPSSEISAAPMKEPPDALQEPYKVLGALREGLLVLGAQGQVEWANRHAASALAVPLRVLRSPDGREALEREVDAAVQSAWRRAADTATATTFAWHDQATERWFEGYAVPVDSGLTIAMHDVSLSRQAELLREGRAAHRREAETLDAIALLAGGVAHNFNNLLTVIAANAELLDLSALAADAPTELSEIRRATTRATKLAQLLLACGRQLALEPAMLPLNTMLGTLEPDIRAMLPTTVRVETSLTRHDSHVYADRVWIEQAILQLVSNARDAMPAGGALRITTERRDLSKPLSARPRSVPAGRWLVLSIEDTGHGVPLAQLERLFEPFHTTREVGSGIGLGLAATYGIAAQSGGTCTVESRHGSGTTVSIWLPALSPTG